MDTLARAIKSEFDVSVTFFGGTVDTERVMTGISPDYAILEPNDFPIETLTIQYNKFKRKPSHRDILGSILGLGIDRSRVGDILLFDERAFVFLDSEIVGFVSSNLEAVGSSKVECSVGNVEDLYLPLEEYKSMLKKVDDLQVSTLVASVFNLSRANITKLISTKKVLLNWEAIKRGEIREGVTITVRGYGRIFVEEIEANKNFSVKARVYG